MSDMEFGNEIITKDKADETKIGTWVTIKIPG